MMISNINILVHPAEDVATNGDNQTTRGQRSIDGEQLWIGKFMDRNAMANTARCQQLEWITIERNLVGENHPGVADKEPLGAIVIN